MRINRKDISFLKYVFEAWEGLAVISTVNAKAGIVAVIMAPDCIHETEMVLTELAGKIMLAELTLPEFRDVASRLDLFDPDRYE